MGMKRTIQTEVFDPIYKIRKCAYEYDLERYPDAMEHGDDNFAYSLAHTVARRVGAPHCRELQQRAQKRKGRDQQ
jgi:hypothetical protein